MLESKLPAFVKKYAGALRELFGTSYDELRKKGSLYEFHSQPLTSIHLQSHLDYEIEPNSDLQIYIHFFCHCFIHINDCLHKFYEPFYC